MDEGARRAADPRWLQAWLRPWRRTVIDRPWRGVALIVLGSLLALLGAQRFDLDASADSLVVHDDPELAYYRATAERFGASEFLIVTFAPPGDALFTPPALAALGRMQRELEALPGVAGVTSMLDVPLLESPPAPVAELARNIRTLRDDGVDLALARAELVASPLYAELLVSADGTATALQVDLEPTPGLLAAIARRDEHLATGGPALADAERALRVLREQESETRHTLIRAVRELQQRHADAGEIRLGGVPMIADDMIEFVRADLLVFGVLITAIIALTLLLFFRRLRWVVLPLATSAVTVLWMVGLVGALGWPVTVVSSNFPALLVITVISLAIHLIVRYQELLAAHGPGEHADLVEATLRSKFVPCLYTSLTTMVAFGSLLSARIVPVVDFGLIMVVGVGMSLLVTWLVFPTLLMLMGPQRTPAISEGSVAMTQAIGRFTAARPGTIVVVAVGLAALSAAGMGRLSLENNFIDYFDADTEIHRGMRWIDHHLGGTTPLDVVLDLGRAESAELDPDDDFAVEDESDPDKYWFTRERMDRIEAVHAWLEARPETGKVLSMATLDRLGRRLNDGEPLDSVALALIYEAIPRELHGSIIRPYADPDSGLARVAVRMRESASELRRLAFLAEVRATLAGPLGFAPEGFHLTGMLVLFSDMLRQIFSSQVATLGWVVGLTAAMFWLLFRSLPVAAIALLPTVFAALCVLGLMGAAGVPLDMMTITIASICVGIGVDDSIHYLHRFRAELRALAPAGVPRPSRAVHVEALLRSHGSIGSAMYFTTVTVVAGFSVLLFSNFVPSLNFGVFTSFAMAFALAANLTMLPALLVLLRPLRVG